MLRVFWVAGFLAAIAGCGGGGGGGGGVSIGPRQVEFEIRPESEYLAGPQGTFVFENIEVVGTSLNPDFWIESGCPPEATCAVSGSGLGRNFYVQMYGTDTPPGSYDVVIAAQYDDIFHEPSDIERVRLRVDVSAAEIAWSYTLTTYPAGPEPQQLALADFDSDGIDDLAVRNVPNDQAPVGLSLLLGVDGGGFSEPKTLGATRISAIAAGDFDGDGNQDIATTNETTGEVKILLGDGSGSFAPSTLGIFRSPFGLSAGDLDADGFDDLLVSMQPYWPDSSIQGISIFYGGAVGFTEPSSYDFNGYDGVSATIIEDFSADGVLDLLLGHGSTLTLMQGTGTRDFLAIDDLPIDRYTTSIGSCRFDADPYVDLLSAKRAAVVPPPGTPVSVEVYEGTGFGFGVGAIVTAGPSGGPLGADLDGNGTCDAIRTGSGIVNVLFGNGGGAFQGQISYLFPYRAYAVFASDRDGDRGDEIIGIHSDIESVFILNTL